MRALSSDAMRATMDQEIGTPGDRSPENSGHDDEVHVDFDADAAPAVVAQPKPWLRWGFFLAVVALLIVVGALVIYGILNRKHATGALTPDMGTAYGTRGGVVSGHYLATNAGMDVLLAGGNAVDAAIAVQFALNVVQVYPCAVYHVQRPHLKFVLFISVIIE